MTKQYSTIPYHFYSNTSNSIWIKIYLNHKIDIYPLSNDRVTSFYFLNYSPFICLWCKSSSRPWSSIFLFFIIHQLFDLSAPSWWWSPCARSQAPTRCWTFHCLHLYLMYVMHSLQKYSISSIHVLLSSKITSI